MIKLLKNKEVRKALLWQLLLSATACAVCFFFDIRAGLTAAGLSLLLMLVEDDTNEFMHPGETPQGIRKFTLGGE